MKRRLTLIARRRGPGRFAAGLSPILAPVPPIAPEVPTIRSPLLAILAQIVTVAPGGPPVPALPVLAEFTPILPDIVTVAPKPPMVLPDFPPVVPEFPSLLAGRWRSLCHERHSKQEEQQGRADQIALPHSRVLVEVIPEDVAGDKALRL
jgi:hypothetical protein